MQPMFTMAMTRTMAMALTALLITTPALEAANLKSNHVNPRPMAKKFKAPEPTHQAAVGCEDGSTLTSYDGHCNDTGDVTIGCHNPKTQTSEPGRCPDD